MITRLVFVFSGLLVLGLAAGAAGLLPGPTSAPSPHPVIRQAQTAEGKRDEELRDTLLKVVDSAGIDDPKTTLIEALDQLSKIHNVTFDVDEKAFADDKVDEVLKTAIAEGHRIQPMKAPLGMVLRKILQRVPAGSGALYRIRKNQIEITTSKAVRAELGIAKDRPLLPLVMETYTQMALVGALNRLADASGYNVVLDARCQEKGNTAVTARLNNVPVDTAVRVLADMAGLSVVRLDNVLYVTSPENARRLQAEQAGKPVEQSAEKKIETPALVKPARP
jgi:hypothetical protein